VCFIALVLCNRCSYLSSFLDKVLHKVNIPFVLLLHLYVLMIVKSDILLASI
jgi:hypothetical protein